MAGLATATVRTENPFEALRLFDDAIRLGISERSIAADRALAFDLLGNFGRAQQDYQLARTVSNSDDLIVKQAISASLGGPAVITRHPHPPVFNQDQAIRLSKPSNEPRNDRTGIERPPQRLATVQEGHEARTWGWTPD